MEKKKNKEMEYARRALKTNLKERFKPQPEWEDKHPVLVTSIILSAIIFRWQTILVIVGGILLFKVVL